METGLPKSLRISSGEVKEAMAPVLNQIIESIKDLIEETPPELVSDILERGLILAGGGSLLTGVDKMISGSTKIPVWVCEEPMAAVVRGCVRVLEDVKLLEKVRVTGGLR